MTTDIRAVPITAGLDGAPERPIRFRREFYVGAELRSAVLHVTALGDRRRRVGPPRRV